MPNDRARVVVAAAEEDVRPGLRRSTFRTLTLTLLNPMQSSTRSTSRKRLLRLAIPSNHLASQSTRKLNRN